MLDPEGPAIQPEESSLAQAASPRDALVLLQVRFSIQLVIVVQDPVYWFLHMKSKNLEIRSSVLTAAPMLSRYTEAPGL